MIIFDTIMVYISVLVIISCFKTVIFFGQELDIERNKLLFLSKIIIPMSFISFILSIIFLLIPSDEKNIMLFRTALFGVFALNCLIRGSFFLNLYLRNVYAENHSQKDTIYLETDGWDEDADSIPRLKALRKTINFFLIVFAFYFITYVVIVFSVK